MKTLVIILLALVAASGSGFSQNLIAVQNGGEPKFYQQVDDAIVNAQDGDTIYIPGGTWIISQAIDKRLHLIGVGHNLDSSKVTLPTILKGDFILAAGASHGSLIGVKCTSIISFTDSISKYVVNRVYVPNISFNEKESSYNTFTENIIGNIDLGSKLKYNVYLNNIIEGRLGNLSKNPSMGDNCTYKNNIFLHKDYYSSVFGQFIVLNYVSNAIFENNIFITDSVNYWGNSTHVTSYSPDNYFYNNLFVDDFIPSVDYPGYNNIVKQDANSIFVNEAKKDYHLQSSCPGKNAGRDGTDIGIYGGAFPWKEGSIPFNPHFQAVQISPKTDANGNLNVNIKVAAQER